MAGRGKSFNQPLVLWEPSQVDIYGRLTVSDPVEIRCRFEEGYEESINPQGESVGADGVIFLKSQIKVQSIVWLGRMIDLPSGTSFSQEDAELFQVVWIRNIPDTKSRHWEHTAGIIRYKDRLPNIT